MQISFTGKADKTRLKLTTILLLNLVSGLVMPRAKGKDVLTSSKRSSEMSMWHAIKSMPINYSCKIPTLQEILPGEIRRKGGWLHPRWIPGWRTPNSAVINCTSAAATMIPLHLCKLSPACCLQHRTTIECILVKLQELLQHKLTKDIIITTRARFQIRPNSLLRKTQLSYVIHTHTLLNICVYYIIGSPLWKLWTARSLSLYTIEFNLQRICFHEFQHGSMI